MPFTVRPYRRFPMPCPVTYHAGLHQGQGTVWNFSLNGWRLSGDVRLRIGQTCSMIVTLPNEQGLFVVAAIVQWRRGHEYGLETLVMEKQTESRLKQYVKRLVQAEAGAKTLRPMRLTI
jgi:PilZ domain